MIRLTAILAGVLLAVTWAAAQTTSPKSKVTVTTVYRKGPPSAAPTRSQYVVSTPPPVATPRPAPPPNRCAVSKASEKQQEADEQGLKDWQTLQKGVNDLAAKYGPSSTPTSSVDREPDVLERTAPSDKENSDPTVDVETNVDKPDYMTFLGARQKQNGPLAEKVQVSLSDETRFTLGGALDFVDNALDRSSDASWGLTHGSRCRPKWNVTPSSWGACFPMSFLQQQCLVWTSSLYLRRL
jgi:hypothetical protein